MTEKPKRRRAVAKPATTNGSTPEQGPDATQEQTLPVILDSATLKLETRSAGDETTLPVRLDREQVKLVDEAPADQPDLPVSLDREQIKLVAAPDNSELDRETAVPVSNLGAADQPAAHGRIDALLAALETEIRAMPSTDEERTSAVAEVVHLIRGSLSRWPKRVIESAVDALKSNINSDYLDADFWKGVSLVLRYQLDASADSLKRRMRGDYAVDEFGLDHEFVDLARPLLTFMYEKYWRVETTGLENVPDSGRALLVCNHSGVLPWDGAMVGVALMNEHPAGRLLRNLHLSWFSSLPFVAPLLSRMGQVQALPANAERLLERDDLVGVFPEGLKGVGKLFKDRYKLARFGRGGFVKVAVKTGAPIIPVSIIGSEEIHPNLYNLKPLAKLLGLPYFPLTPTFPLLGPLGLIPLPSKWYIIFGEPIPTAEYGAKRAEDPLLVAQLTEQVRSTIQSTILEKLKTRPGVFLGE